MGPIRGVFKTVNQTTSRPSSHKIAATLAGPDAVGVALKIPQGRQGVRSSPRVHLLIPVKPRRDKLARKTLEHAKVSSMMLRVLYSTSYFVRRRPRPDVGSVKQYCSPIAFH